MIIGRKAFHSKEKYCIMTKSDEIDGDNMTNVEDVWNDNNKPNTSEVLEALRAAERIEDFSREYGSCFVDITFKDYLTSLLETHGISKYAAVKASGISDSYAFQIFQGSKSPSRDKLLSLAIGMQINLKECQRLLKLAGVNELYAKNRRDAIIIFGLEKGLTVPQLNDILFDMKEFAL